VLLAESASVTTLISSVRSPSLSESITGSPELPASVNVNFDGSAWAYVTAGGAPGAARTAVWSVVSVANGSSATAAIAPNITLYLATLGDHVNNDDTFVGYWTSAVNTFEVSAWSTVQLKANASTLSVVETGRNTGVFEGEFIIADTEGVNDATVDIGSVVVSSAGAIDDSQCGASGNTAAVTGTAIGDGRYDRSSGINADCEFINTADLDIAGADVGAGGALTANLAIGTLPAGSRILDIDGNGDVNGHTLIHSHTGGFADVDITQSGVNDTMITLTTSGDNANIDIIQRD
jgi:hypothetical protein